MHIDLIGLALAISGVLCSYELGKNRGRLEILALCLKYHRDK